MKVRIAYLEEPPFYWTASDGSVTGADIELADVTLRAIGVSTIEHQAVAFDELLSGVQLGRWHMNVPIFVTAERAKQVAFSRPVWALSDGFLVRAGNPKALTSYETLASRTDARLGIVQGQVQHASAKSLGVRDDQIVIFKDQAAAVAALQAKDVDAYAATALGNRVLVREAADLEAVALDTSKRPPLVGAFSVSKDNLGLLTAVNEQLRRYLGSSDHLSRLEKYGLTRTEIDAVRSGTSP